MWALEHTLHHLMKDILEFHLGTICTE